MDLRTLLIAVLILIFSGGCCRLTEKILASPNGELDLTGEPYYGEEREPELQPPDQYRFDVPHATVLMEDNDVYGNNSGGLRIRGTLPVHITGCSFHHNGMAGIRAEYAHLYLDHSSIFANRAGGVEMVAVKQVSMRDVRIFLNGEGGIRVQRCRGCDKLRSVVDIRNSRIYLNRQGGIVVRAGAAGHAVLLFAGNTLFANERAGARVEGNISLTAYDNVFSSNGTAGLSVYGVPDHLPEIDIYQNRICFNHGSGLFVSSGKTGEYGISNNWIYNNLRAGIACGLAGSVPANRSRLAILHNTIVSNGSGSIGAGIRDDTEGVTIIRNNIIAFNSRTGIMVHNCDDACHNLLFANGETSKFDQNDESAYLFERLQYAGCPGRGRGDVIAPPLFSNPDRYDFTLKQDSPARGAGEEIDTPYFSWFGSKDMGSLYVPPRLWDSRGRAEHGQGDER